MPEPFKRPDFFDEALDLQRDRPMTLGAIAAYGRSMYAAGLREAALTAREGDGSNHLSETLSNLAEHFDDAAAELEGEAAHV